MKHQLKSNSGQQHEHAAEKQTGQNSAREFATVEELLRLDARQTTVPPAIAERLGRSLQNESSPPRSWWKNLFRTRS